MVPWLPLALPLGGLHAQALPMRCKLISASRILMKGQCNGDGGAPRGHLQNFYMLIELAARFQKSIYTWGPRSNRKTVRPSKVTYKSRYILFISPVERAGSGCEVSPKHDLDHIMISLLPKLSKLKRCSFQFRQFWQ